MKYSPEEEQLSRRLRQVMQTHAPEVIKNDRVNGVGVAWRDGTFKFVVQTHSMLDVEPLRRQLPDRVDDFPLFVEVRTLACAASNDLSASETVRTPRLSALAWALRALVPSRRWLAFMAEPRPQPL